MERLTQQCADQEKCIGTLQEQSDRHRSWAADVDERLDRLEWPGTMPTAAAPPTVGAVVDEESFWEAGSQEGLLRAQEAIANRFPDEDDDAVRARFEKSGTEDAARLEPYYGPSSCVLEIGCGIGRVLKHVRARERWGLDISSGMLNLAKVYMAQEENLHLGKSNGFDFQGVPSGYFDLVYSLLVLQHMNRRAAFNYLRETYRVLKPGGHFFLEFMNLLSDDGFQHFLNVLTLSYPLELYTPQEVEYYLQRAGLEVERVYAEGERLYAIGHKPSAQD